MVGSMSDGRHHMQRMHGLAGAAFALALAAATPAGAAAEKRIAW